MRVENQHSKMMRQEQKEESQRQKDWDEVDGVRQGVGSRDTVRHTERNDQLYVTKMLLVVQREMKSECYEEVEQRWDYRDMKVEPL